MDRAGKLVYMANQIAANFAPRGDEGAAAATAEHINRFWDPGMRSLIASHRQGSDHGLTPTAARAVDLIAPKG